MKIYITGIAGLIGSNLAKQFLREGHTIKGCDNLIGGLQSNLDLIKNHIEVDYIDILDFDKLKESIKGSDVVIHTAALAYEGLSVFSPAIVSQNILAGSVNVASACIANDTKLMVNCSSMARYGAQTPPFTEDMTPAPEDPYGLAKVQAEQHFALLDKLHGFNYVTVVPHNVIGKGQRYMDPFRNVVGIMINRCLRNEPIIVYGDGLQKRSFSNIFDCVMAIRNIIMEDERDLKGEVYNIGPDDNEITIKDLAYKVGHACERYPNLKFFPDRPGEVKYAWCSSEKIKKDFGYKTTFTMEETISQMVNWIRKEGTKPFEYHLELEFIKDYTPKTWTEKLI